MQNFLQAFCSLLLQEAVVRRVCPNLGLMLELPMEPSPRAGFAHVSNILDSKSDKLEKVQRQRTLLTS